VPIVLLVRVRPAALAELQGGAGRVTGADTQWRMDHVKYVLLFVETEEFERELEAMGPDERARAVARVSDWLAVNADKLRGGNKLQAAETATTVRLDRGDPVVVDGPFVEGKEVVSGYSEIEVANLDEALGMVRTWPGCPIVEIRPIESMTV
jgi:hypothetical protein